MGPASYTKTVITFVTPQGDFYMLRACLFFKGKTLAVLLGGGATCVFALFPDLAKPLEDTLSNTFGCLRTQKCSDTRFHSCLLNW